VFNTSNTEVTDLFCLHLFFIYFRKYTELFVAVFRGGLTLPFGMRRNLFNQF